MESLYANEKSDKVIVPKKHSNKKSFPSAEYVEGRTIPKRNTSQATTVRTQNGVAALSGLAGVRQAVRQNKDVQFTALLHHLSVDLLEQGYLVLKRNSAPGPGWCKVAGLWRKSP